MKEPMYDDDLEKIKAIVICSTELQKDFVRCCNNDNRKAVDMLVDYENYVRASIEKRLERESNWNKYYKWIHGLDLAKYLKIETKPTGEIKYILEKEMPEDLVILAEFWMLIPKNRDEEEIKELTEDELGTDYSLDSWDINVFRLVEMMSDFLEETRGKYYTIKDSAEKLLKQINNDYSKFEEN